MNFVGAKFCCHCGSELERGQVHAVKARNCPRCRQLLRPVAVGSIVVVECKSCEGLWLDTVTLAKLCQEKERQTVVLGAMPQRVEEEQAIEPIAYVPCPECGDLMNRVNFSGYSGVVVDVCREHGTWFDRDELRRIVEFIQRGGLQEAREKKVKELEYRARRAKEAAADAHHNNVAGRTQPLTSDNAVEPWWLPPVLWAGAALAVWFRIK